MPEPIDIAAVRRLRFEISVFLDEIAGRAADQLEAVALTRAKLEQLERECEGRGARPATLTPPAPTTDDTE